MKKNLVNKSEIYILVKKCDLNKKLESLTTKTVLKTKQDIMVNLKINDLSYFLGKMRFVGNVFKNMLIYQLTLRLKLKLIMLLAGNQMGVNSATLKPSCTKLLHNINLSSYTVGIKFDKDPLAVEQNN